MRSGIEYGSPKPRRGEDDDGDYYDTSEGVNWKDLESGKLWKKKKLELGKLGEKKNTYTYILTFA
jgi:hypothetical protein